MVHCDFTASTHATRMRCDPSKMAQAIAVFALDALMLEFLGYHCTAFVKTLCDIVFGVLSHQLALAQSSALSLQSLRHKISLAPHHVWLRLLLEP